MRNTGARDTLEFKALACGVHLHTGSPQGEAHGKWCYRLYLGALLWQDEA